MSRSPNTDTMSLLVSGLLMNDSNVFASVSEIVITGILAGLVLSIAPSKPSSFELLKNAKSR
ncbi:hypothetical protein D3C87_1905430 [compost metagenome]